MQSKGKSERKSIGKVYLVGGGPGDLGLVTLRAKECIERADVIVYDHLANPEMLGWARDDAEIIYAGKKAGEHALSQEEINKLLIENARAGKGVVRLKGGDPFVFGRGAEEAKAIGEAGIAFEIVPGITSAIAGPAYAGIPVTHRSENSHVTFFTGHEDPSKTKSAIDYAAYAGDADGSRENRGDFRRNDGQRRSERSSGGVGPMGDDGTPGNIDRHFRKHCPARDRSRI